MAQKVNPKKLPKCFYAIELRPWPYLATSTTVGRLKEQLRKPSSYRPPSKSSMPSFEGESTTLLKEREEGRFDLCPTVV